MNSKDGEKGGRKGREPSAGARKKTSGNGGREEAGKAGGKEERGKEEAIFGVFWGKKRKKEG